MTTKSDSSPVVYLITWIEPSKDDPYYPFVAHHKVARSLSDTARWFDNVIDRQDSLNDNPDETSLPMPQVFRVCGSVKAFTDDDYCEIGELPVNPALSIVHPPEAG